MNIAETGLMGATIGAAVGIAFAWYLHYAKDRKAHVKDGNLIYKAPPAMLYSGLLSALFFLFMLTFSLLDTHTFNWPQMVFSLFTLLGIFNFLRSYRYALRVNDNEADYTSWKGRKVHFRLSDVTSLSYKPFKGGFTLHTAQGEEVVIPAATRGGRDFFQRLLDHVSDDRAAQMRQVLTKARYIK